MANPGLPVGKELIPVCVYGGKSEFSTIYGPNRKAREAAESELLTNGMTEHIPSLGLHLRVTAKLR